MAYKYYNRPIKLAAKEYVENRIQSISLKNNFTRVNMYTFFRGYVKDVQCKFPENFEFFV